MVFVYIYIEREVHKSLCCIPFLFNSIFIASDEPNWCIKWLLHGLKQTVTNSRAKDVSLENKILNDVKREKKYTEPKPGGIKTR